MADDEARAARQKALAEKKRRLEEIKARRRQQSDASTAGSGSVGGGSTAISAVTSVSTSSNSASSTNAATTTTTSATGLDEYIDELLKTSTPGLVVPPATGSTAQSTAETKEVSKETEAVKETSKETAVEGPSNPSAEAKDSTKDSSKGSSKGSSSPSVETFEIAIQTEEEDFPPVLLDEDDPPEEKEDVAEPPAEKEPALPPPPSALSASERAQLLSSPPFSQFLTSASKRVERLLGADGLPSLLSGIHGDFASDYALAQKPVRRSTHSSETAEPWQAGGRFLAKATYEHPRWTRGRDVTDIHWCPSHKEWLLASYNSVASDEVSSAPTTRYLAPTEPPSSFLTNPTAIPSEGIIALWNLAMPHRPEHVFCSGCPILHSNFHPTEHPKLVLGGASSGQILVWDARVGRYPVQRSGMSGHNCGLVGMTSVGPAGVAGMLVTASSDGSIHYWNVANFRDPVEHVKINANLSCLTGLGHSEGLVCGDEMGGVHVVLPGTGGSTRRVVKSLHPGQVLSDDQDGLGHYGMVTSISTPSGAPLETSGLSRGFMRGPAGLMVTTGVDWSTQLWAPAYSDKPLMSFLSHSYDYMSDVQWSPVHPSIFATASSNGTLHLWNLATSLDQPMETIEFHESRRRGLNKIRWSQDGKRMAIASGDKLHVMGCAEELWKKKDDEARIIQLLINRGFLQQEQI